LMVVQPTDGGYGGLGFDEPLAYAPTEAPGALTLGKQNRSQIYSVSVSPYVVHRFGTFGTGKAGVGLTETYEGSGVGGGQIPGAATTSSQHALTGEATAQFQSGTDFGRLRDFAVIDAAETEGSGVLRHAHRAEADNWIGYVLNRELTPFVELGAETISYSSTPAYRVDDAIWQLGVVLTPGPNSRLTVGYGHHQGFNAFNARGYYQMTARTRLTVNYDTSLVTDLQQIEDQLGLADADQFGQPLDATTGGPLLLGTGGLLGLQGNVYRNRRFGFTASTALERDTIALTIQFEHETPVASAIPGAGVEQQGESATASWLHQLSERTNLTAGASYSRTSLGTTTGGRERFLAASAGISYLLSETISTTARYTFFDRRSTFQDRSFDDNVVLLAVSKKF
ncbi:MAG: outer membrane beta-barrel protein, partial [Pseudomonadota bacterium]|nr:outer membrane beta-barrel protein [Pseudomonadota bacterium]